MSSLLTISWQLIVGPINLMYTYAHVAATHNAWVTCALHIAVGLANLVVGVRRNISTASAVTWILQSIVAIALRCTMVPTPVIYQANQYRHQFHFWQRKANLPLRRVVVVGGIIGPGIASVPFSVLLWSLVAPQVGTFIVVNYTSYREWETE